MDCDGESAVNTEPSIIELAVRRLEELRRSGTDVPPHSLPAANGAAAHSRLASLVQPVPHPEGQSSRPAAHGFVAGKMARPTSSSSTSKAVHIDLARLAAMQYVDPTAQRSQIASEFRVVKRPLLLDVMGSAEDAASERSNLIMVTSSVPGEGKTYVSINLAISLAMEVDRTVLLVDADVSRPSVLQRLGLPPSTACSTS